MKILLIEDEKPIAKALRSGLSTSYLVDLAYTGKKGIYKALTNDYDLIILDLNLPDTSGFEVCQELRQAQLSCPILVLTGKNLAESKAVLLDAGTDDYVVKPFSLVEIKARMRALLRRHNAPTGTTTKIGQLSLNPQTQTVLFNHKPLSLSKKEFLLLQYFLRHRNVPLSRLQIAEHIWEGASYLTSNTVDVHVCNLRRKIGLPDSNQLIKTMHGIGYKLVAENN